GDGRFWLELAYARGGVADRANLGILLGLIAMEQGDLARAEQVMDAGLVAARAAIGRHVQQRRACESRGRRARSRTSGDGGRSSSRGVGGPAIDRQCP